MAGYNNEESIIGIGSMTVQAILYLWWGCTTELTFMLVIVNIKKKTVKTCNEFDKFLSMQ